MAKSFERKSIIFLVNKLTVSNGVSCVLVNLCNVLSAQGYEVTVAPLYEVEPDAAARLDDSVCVKKAFGLNFRGFNRLVRLIPACLLYNWIIHGSYDIEVAFQCDNPTRIVGVSKNEEAVHVTWMHGYDYCKEFHKSDSVVCVATACAARLRNEHGLANATCSYNIVDSDFVIRQAKEPSGITWGVAPRLVSVGRLSPEKGYVALMHALSALRRDGIDFRFVLVGDGPERRSIEDAVRKLGLRDAVTLVGEQTNPHKYTTEAELFVCSSTREGYSTACTEAAILGVPILTTDVYGGQEVVDECGCGLVVEATEHGLKEGLREVLTSPGLLESWKQTLSETKESFTSAERGKAALKLFDQFSHLSDQKAKRA